MSKKIVNTESGLQEYINKLYQVKDLIHFCFNIDPGTGIVSIRTDTTSGSASSSYITNVETRHITSTTPLTPVAFGITEQFTKLIVQAHRDNSDDIAIGSAVIKAASGTGRMMIAYWTEIFENGNLSDLYLDVISPGDGVVLTILK